MSKYTHVNFKYLNYAVYYICQLEHPKSLKLYFNCKVTLVYYTKLFFLIAQFIKHQQCQIEAITSNAIQLAYKNTFTEFY